MRDRIKSFAVALTATVRQRGRHTVTAGLPRLPSARLARLRQANALRFEVIGQRALCTAESPLEVAVVRSLAQVDALRQRAVRVIRLSRSWRRLERLGGLPDLEFRDLLFKIRDQFSVRSPVTLHALFGLPFENGFFVFRHCFCLERDRER